MLERGADLLTGSRPSGVPAPAAAEELATAMAALRQALDRVEQDATSELPVQRAVVSDSENR